MAATADKDKDEALKRLGGGRWQTRDARFTIEPQSGTWVVVDAEQVDDLGLPLVRGPFGSLGAAKAAIAEARTAEPVTSPLPARVERIQGASSASSAVGGKARSTKLSSPRKAKVTPRSTEPEEPSWITHLDPDERRRARRLVERLESASARDAEGIARRDVVGQVPATAAFAVVRRILALGPGPSRTEVATLLVEGQDDDLGVRWRLVDGLGRPITLDLDALDTSEDV